ncbi:MAG: RnfABCDGE type electron transport complex subunit D [Elusimicrobia bacterium]|nr:RnfABCDGE type electron transport complex subunit D [Elusimicrobiota bacterium]
MSLDNSKIKLNVSPAPHIKEKQTLPDIMKITLWALAFPAAGSIFFFGVPALLLIIVTSLSALLAEIFVLKFLRKGKKGIGSPSDMSALITGLILALVLPAGFPLWAAGLGAAFAIIIVKHTAGGLGRNIFNPALMGRAFLTAAFPVMITTYAINYRSISDYEAVSSATPLSAAKFERGGEEVTDAPLLAYFIGEKKGSLGETSPLLILIGLSVLLIGKAADWRLPAAYFGSFIFFSILVWLFYPGYSLDPLTSLFTGGVMLGGAFMVTDPVTTPVTPKGKLVFGIGAGFLTMLIRVFSGYPEGVMFSILLMNAVTPLINRVTPVKKYGSIG